MLVAFGGAGPVHVCHLADKLRIRRILVPLRAGVLSALGLSARAAAYDLARTRKTPLAELDRRGSQAMLRGNAGGDRAKSARGCECAGELRGHAWAFGYIGQGYQVPVSVDADHRER